LGIAWRLAGVVRGGGEALGEAAGVGNVGKWPLPGQTVTAGWGSIVQRGCGSLVVLPGRRADGPDLQIDISALAIKPRRGETISAMVYLGLPTRQIAGRLRLTTDTVQDQLKSVFDRTSVHSRGELVALILPRDYLPHAVVGGPLSPSGAFAVG
jgi:DNA-binding CsgD family transcriptional regulator